MKSSPSSSDPVPVPGQPHITAISATATSISLSWASTGSVVTSYEVMWQALSSNTDTILGTDSDEESGTSGTITDTSYTIEELESTTIYNVTVTVTNAAGSSESHPIRITTGKTQVMCIYSEIYLCYTL